MKKNILLLSACALILGAANCVIARDATNINIQGSNSETAPLTLSSQLLADHMASDSLLWKGNGQNKRNDAYVLVDGQYTFLQFFVSGGGGAYSNLNMEFKENSSLTLTSGTGFGFNGSEYVMDMNFTSAGANTNIIFNTGYEVSLAYKTLSDKNNNGELKRNISFGTGLTVTNKQTLKVTGAEGSKFTINSNWNTLGKTEFINGTVDIGGNYTSTGTTNLNNVTLNVTGTFISNGATTTTTTEKTKNTTINIEENATFKTAGSLTFDAGITAKIAGTLEVDGNLLFDKEGGLPTVTIADGATIKAQSFRTRSLPLVIGNGTKMILNHTTDSAGSTYINAGASRIAAGGSLSITTQKAGIDAITNHSSLQVDGALSVTDGDIATAAGGISFNSSDITLTNSNLSMGNESDLANGTFRINADNDFSNSILLLCRYTNKAETHKLYIGNNVDVALKGLSFSKNEKFAEGISLKITLGENSTLALTDFISSIDGFGTLGDADMITIDGFRENAISIKNHTDADDSLLSKIAATGITDPLRWNFDSINNVYWLSATAAVPEPAEWAAILGALALSLAIYRRRK